MTEGHESDFLVKVRAQVMTRDESTEGWLPLAGGGLANVSIRKRSRLSPGAAGHEYIIYGQRISDQSVILSCVINRDLKYYKVMPTFHHWRAGKQRNGLTFQTAADARAFDKGVLRAYNELIDGITKLNPSIIIPPLTKYDSVGEDDVFMTLDLPVETDSVQKTHSSPEGSEKSHKSINNRCERHKETINNINENDINKIDTPIIHYISTDQTTSNIQASNSPNISINTTSTSTNAINTAATNITTTMEPPPTIAPSENYSYVTLTAVHDYNYPVVDEPPAAQVLNARRESISALKKRNAMEAAQTLGEPNIPATIKKTSTQRIRCRYCHELYQEEYNRRGACEFAPDCIRSGIEYITGIGCARCMMYHCMSDAEGETAQHPCDCSNEGACTKRWIGLSLLSILVPCLWCYPPLRACHYVGVSCGACGGRHRPEV